MHARIARLYAHNYRSFVNFELRPGRRSLLVGYNGSGKSSVLDVLHAIRALVVHDVDATAAFPTNTVAKLGGSNDQHFELDLETERGPLHYVLHTTHDLEKSTSAITREALSLDAKPLYRFAEGEVQLYSEQDSSPKDPFPFSAQRSFLAALDPKHPLSPIVLFKELIERSWILRIDPAHIVATAPEEADGMLRSGADFASYCRHLLQERPAGMQRAYEALQQIMPGFQNLRMQSAGRAKVLTATFRQPGGPAYDLDFDTLSDGQKTLVVLYTVLHTVAHELPVLCLDEPDNFVSIREIQPFLTELADLSDETGLQVMLISHSPEVIDYVGPSDAILFERPDGGHTRVRTVDAKGPLRLSELMARGWLAEGS
jgi:predicted ATPase